MKSKIKRIGMLLLFGFYAAGTVADEARHSHQQKPKAIPQEIKTLITQEMQALQQGMRELIPAIVSGDWSRLEGIGRQMRDSYIIKQKLTKAQKKVLQATLPESFKKMDQVFHSSAGMLSDAAKKRDMEQVVFYYSKMTESCVNCHSQHATQRFPALADTPQVTHTFMSECNTMRRLAVALAGGDTSSLCGDGEELEEEVY
ncbi:MAG: hypothetical protein L3J26_06295 [Candidatus Polarisedimenticolaceae bacterium]|nr:hypothetical protein [Candidatus Polarisedimenticolaceae bacterium]